MNQMVNRIDYKDKEGHFDVLDTPVPVEVLKYVDKYFAFDYTKATNAKCKTDLEFFGSKDFGDAEYRIYLKVSLNSSFSGMYPYELTVVKGLFSCLYESGFITPEGRFARIQRNIYV